MSNTAITLNEIQDKNIFFFIPDFQRKFVWTEDDIVSLGNSIIKGYPILSLLFINGNINENSFLRMIKYRGINKKNFSTDEVNKVFSSLGSTFFIVIDGQQRLTAINELLTDKNYIIDLKQLMQYIKEKDNTDENTDLSELEIVKKTDGNTECECKVPFKVLLEPYKIFSLQCLDDNEKALLGAFASKISKYKIPCVLFSSNNDNFILETFERINTTGTKLTYFELINAKSFSYFKNNGYARSLKDKILKDIDNIFKNKGVVIKREAIFGINPNFLEFMKIFFFLKKIDNNEFNHYSFLHLKRTELGNMDIEGVLNIWDKYKEDIVLIFTELYKKNLIKLNNPNSSVFPYSSLSSFVSFVFFLKKKFNINSVFELKKIIDNIADIFILKKLMLESMDKTLAADIQKRIEFLISSASNISELLRKSIQLNKEEVDKLTQNKEMVNIIFKNKKLRHLLGKLIYVYDGIDINVNEKIVFRKMLKNKESFEYLIPHSYEDKQYVRKFDLEKELEKIKENPYYLFSDEKGLTLEEEFKKRKENMLKEINGYFKLKIKEVK